ncbi:ATP-dependent DNA ligase [Geomonas limicola]|uniref:DNA ligase (ATP) n=1 Tax=Geomonas limicola TaxID=2740186 RepID=A0A6V8N522_9BACT|nr:DNA ligase D [Geomonas limicola]GFO67655.1 ATP-dependent DNA ligase [Geomonas limicola]
MGLEEYQKKRDFSSTPEPAASLPNAGQGLRFVVQKHAASHLHYDLRLELDGVLKSWAVPKGPSLDPSLKRLAMMVEDHPFDYRSFEGTIPKGNYGAGEVIVWDEGTYAAPGVNDLKESERVLRAGLAKGDLKFVLHGRKLNGEFALVKMHSEQENTWLLIKKKDTWATTEEVTLDDRSVLSDLRLDDAGKAEVLIASATLPEPPSDPLPRDVKPMLATLVDEAFDNPGWIFEIKQDGYRAIAQIESGRVELYSRNNLSFNRNFTAIVRALESLPGNLVLDGEVVALDEQGRSSFQLLQNHLRTGQGPLCYFVFDLLYRDGHDLRGLPLLARKEQLRALLPDLPELRFSDHISETGKDFFELARQNNLEGIVAKRADSSYQSGRRSRDWLKIKIRHEQEAIICGFTQPRGGRGYFGSLVLGAFQGGELVHIGFSGGGFDERMLREIHAKLSELVQPESPFAGKVKAEMPITWVTPRLVCEVTFSEWTDEGVMRHPIFLGLREDKDPESVLRELPIPTQLAEAEAENTEVSAAAPPEAAGPADPQAAAMPPRLAGTGKNLEVIIGGRRLKLSNLDKIFWPDEGYTKGDLIDYYRQVAPVMLPYLKDRPESLYRTPNGIAEKGFFQKEAGELPPEWMPTREIFSESNQKTIKYFICQEEATLVYLANLGCIEINPWLSRLDRLDSPDYFVIDLDPEDISFDRVVEAAQAVHQVLERAGAPGYPKTSGATGIHIYIPLGARYDYDAAVKFAQVVATLAHQLVPDFTSLVRDPRKRQQRVYLDYLQNRGGQTLAAPYSVRPRPGATVSTPLTWDEVRIGLNPGSFTIKTVPARLAERGDLFRQVLGPGIDLERCLDNLLKPYR